MKEKKKNKSTSHKKVGFKHDAAEQDQFKVLAQIHELPDVYDDERGQYWYNQAELQDMLKTAIVETNEMLKQAAAKAKSNTATNNASPSQEEQEEEEQHTLRGLESLSPQVQARKQQIELERLRVIQAYQKQAKQTKGDVNWGDIRSLYTSYTSMDVKRAAAYGLMDAQESYCFGAAAPKKKLPARTPSGLFGRMFSSSSSTRKGKKKPPKTAP